MTLARISSVSLMSGATLASRILGFGKNSVLAAALGTAVVGDTYNVANTIPNLIFTVLAGGVLSAVFVPQLVRAFTQSNIDGEEYASRLVTLAVVVLVPATVVLTLSAPLVIAAAAPADWTSGEIALATSFAYMCLPQVFFYALYAVLGQVLNARHKFGAMAWAPAANNVVVIVVAAGVIAWGGVQSNDVASVSSATTIWLGVGTTVGVVLQALILVVASLRSGIRLRPRLRKGAIGLSKAVGLAKWSVAQLAVTQIAAFLVLRAAASTAAPLMQEYSIAAGFSSFNYAYLVALLPHAVIAMSIATTMMPVISRHLGDGDGEGYTGALTRAVRSITITMVPITVFLSVGAPIVAKILFAHGETSPSDAWYIGLVLTAFAIGLVPMSTRSVYLYAMYANEETRRPFYVAALAAILYAVFAFAAAMLLPPFWRTIGVAGSLTVSNAIAVVIMRTMLDRGQGGPRRMKLGEHARVWASAVIGIVVAQAVSLVIGGGIFFAPPAETGQFGQTILQTIALLVGGVVYLALAILLKVSPLAAFRRR